MITGIHVFRKDLRIKDNLALKDLSAKVDRIIGVFVFDPKQIYSKHASKHSIQFLIESLYDLNEQLPHLNIFEGDPIHVLQRLIKDTKATVMSLNSDFTQYALKRDKQIADLCKRANVELITREDDQSLVPSEQLLKSDGSPYMTFSSFYSKLSSLNVEQPIAVKAKFVDLKVKYPAIMHKHISQPSIIMGGRAEALKHMKNCDRIAAADYVDTETSKLSAYLNFGCISIRELYWKLKESNKSAIRSIAWRDFYACIFRFVPNGNSYTKHIDSRYDQIKWPRLKKAEWDRFMRCETGFLLIDAAMAELLATGYINNRARLLLATFWIKYLIVSEFDTEYGSQIWFSRLLIDCSASLNKLNHQWVLAELDLAGRRFAQKGAHPLTGRMIRIDNDMIKKYDPEFNYIKKWIPRFAGKSIKECKTMAKQTETMYDWRQRYNEYVSLFRKLSR